MRFQAPPECREFCRDQSPAACFACTPEDSLRRAEGASTAPPPPPEHILQFFAYERLPPHLQAVSAPFCELAQRIVASLPRNPERTVALRKLLEGKDAAVRAFLAKP